jgi:hypothetical protein
MKRDELVPQATSWPAMLAAAALGLSLALLGGCSAPETEPDDGRMLYGPAPYRQGELRQEPGPWYSGGAPESIPPAAWRER